MEVHAAPYLDPYVAGGSILVKMGRIEADLPEWLDVVIFGLSLVLPPVTILLPNVLAALIHNALVDVSNRLNGRAVRNGFSLYGISSLFPEHRDRPTTSSRVECAPEAGQDQAAGLTVCRAWWSSNWAGLR